MIHLKKTTRVEIIDENGRQFVRHNIKRVDLSMQNSQRTMKIFLNNKITEKVPEEDCAAGCMQYEDGTIRHSYDCKYWEKNIVS